VAKFNAGVWIDHRKAIMVFVSAAGERTAHLVSKVETQWRRAGDSPLKGRYASDQVPADDSRQKALTGELSIYYDAVIAALRNAESFIIFGPGEAKKELKARLEKQKLAGRLSVLKAADKMTDRQIAAEVRKYFTLQVPEKRTR
jgi:hypothetical protein